MAPEPDPSGSSWPKVAAANADVVARILVEALEPLLGQSIVVEKQRHRLRHAPRPRMSATPAPDGYTLLVGTSSQLVHNIALFEPLPVDIETTLRGVAMINEVPMVMCVPNESPDADLAALTARLQADPASFQIRLGPCRHHDPYLGRTVPAADRGRGRGPYPLSAQPPRRWST